MGARTRTTVLVAVLLLVGLAVAGGADRASEPPIPPTIAHAGSEAPGAAEGEAVAGGAVEGWLRQDPVRPRSVETPERDPEVVSAPTVPLDVEHGPGTFTVVPGVGDRVGEGRVWTFAIEVEDHLEDHAATFAAEVERMLLDRRGWTAARSVALRRTDGSADIRVTLASPRTVDALCAPLRTNRRFSCWNGAQAVINAWRWQHGAAAYGDDLEAYRTYLVNHEVGHGLGHGHVGCPFAGAPAPVMMQQTIGVDGCVPNPWPYPEGTD